MTQELITIVGGTGFVGRYVVKLLARQGYRLRIVARRPDKAQYLKLAGQVGQIALQYGDVSKPETLEGKLEGSSAVINLVGVLFEAGRQNFHALHAQGAERLAKMAKAAGVTSFVHISAIGVDKSIQSKYARSKATGEKAVIAAFPEATILRPSIIFGPEDQFFNKFASMATFFPALPLIGGGRTRFQPVYVGDVAGAVLAALQYPACRGHIYELGGPTIYSFRQLLEFILKTTGRKRWLMPIPMGLASLMGTFMELLPSPPLTRDQVKLLQYDNIVSRDAHTLRELGIAPTSVEVRVPEYLARFRKPGRLDHQSVTP